MSALEVFNGTALVAAPAAAALLNAFAQGDIAVSFSVSGFLISYFAGGLSRGYCIGWLVMLCNRMVGSEVSSEHDHAVSPL